MGKHKKKPKKDKEKELQDVRSKAASIIEEVRFQGDLMLEELEKAAQVFVVCVKLASVEKLLAE